MAALLRVVREVEFGALKATEAAPDPKDKGCEPDVQRYIQTCRRLRELHLRRWGPHGPRVLDPDSEADLRLIHALFNSVPPAAN